MKCNRCKRTVEKVTEALCTGDRGYRRYKICDKCLAEVKKDNLKK